MKVVKVDPTMCIGCGTCAAIAENMFEINPEDGLAVVKNPDAALTGDDLDLAEQAVTCCPSGAISIQDK